MRRWEALKNSSWMSPSFTCTISRATPLTLRIDGLNLAQESASSHQSAPAAGKEGNGRHRSQPAPRQPVRTISSSTSSCSGTAHSTRVEDAGTGTSALSETSARDLVSLTRSAKFCTFPACSCPNGSAFGAAPSTRSACTGVPASADSRARNERRVLRQAVVASPPASPLLFTASSPNPSLRARALLHRGGWRRQLPVAVARGPSAAGDGREGSAGFNTVREKAAAMPQLGEDGSTSTSHAMLEAATARRLACAGHRCWCCHAPMEGHCKGSTWPRGVALSLPRARSSFERLALAWFPPQTHTKRNAAQVEDGGKEGDVGQGRGVLPDDALELCAECLVKRKFHSPHREQSVVSLSSVLIVLDLSSCCDWHDSWRRASRKRAPRKRHRPRRLRPGAAGVSRLRPANPEGHSRQERPNSKESSKALVSAAAHGPWPSPPHPNTSQVSPCPSTPTSPEKAALRCARMEVPRSCPCW